MSIVGRRLRAVKISAFVLSLVLFVTAISVLGVDVLRRLDRLGSATSDNVQWTLSQLEVDFLHLDQSVDAAVRNDGSLEEVRRHFDLFYSRFETIRSSSLYGEIRFSPRAPERMARINAFLNQAIPAIDGSDERLRDHIPAMHEQMEAIESSVRQLAISGVTVFSGVSDEERERVAVTLLRLALAVAALVLLLMGAALSLARSVRTSERRAQKLRDSTRRLETIISTSLDAVIMADENGDILDVGGSATDLFGLRKSELLQTSLCDLMYHDEMMSVGKWLSHKQRLNTVLGPGPVGSRQTRIRVTGLRADGGTFPVEMSIADAVSSSGPIVVAYLRDISARIEGEQALMQARDDALVAARSKAEFLAVMSHEMRTPLWGLIGTMENLRNTDLNPQQQEWLEIMEASGRILQDHVNDVLDIAKLEAGKAALQTEPVDLPDLLCQLVEQQKSIAAQRGNHIALEIPQEPFGLVMVDPPRLRQILLNLLGNAIKFTTEGRITLGMKVVAQAQDEVQLELFVADTGVGIPKERQKDIFDDFVTLDSAYSRQVSGTGLGLGIVRRLVSIMGGEIKLESVERVGSRFAVSLTVKRAAAVEARPDSIQPLVTKLPERPLRVLLFEDNAINRKVVVHQLEEMGHEVTAAEDGLRAEEIVGKSRFDVILMDISMPNRDGMATTKAIRAEGLNTDTPIIALTAHALPDEVARFHAVGMQACLTKPVQTRVLSETLHQWAKNGAHSGEEVTQAPQVEPGPAEPDPAEPDHDAANGDAPPLVDTQHLAEMQNELGAALYEKLCGAAIQDGDRLVAELQGLASSPEAGEVAHRLAGTAASFGARRLHAAIAAAEGELRAPATAPEDRATVIEALTALWAETRPLLDPQLGANAIPKKA